MDDEEKRKQRIVLLVAGLCCCVLLGGVVCLIVAFSVVGSRSCAQLCGEKYSYEDTNYNCCTTQSSYYKDCVVKSECGPWETLFQVGLYIVGSAVILCCCCAAALGKGSTPTTTVTYAAPVRKRKFVLVEVDD